MLKTIKYNQKGGTLLVYTVMVFSAMMITVFALNSVVLNSLKVSSTQAEGTRAFFAAEAGAEWLINEVFTNGNTPNADCGNNDLLDLSNISSACNGGTNTITLSNNATFSVVFVDPVPVTVPPSTYSFKCIGEFQNAQRMVQISF